MLDKQFTLTFDKTPTLIYVQNGNFGIGDLYMNGKQIRGLQAIEILAKSNDDSIYLPELKLKIIPEELAKFGTVEE